MPNPIERLEEFERKGLCGRRSFINKLTSNYLEKARHNLTVSSILKTIENDKEIREALNLSEDFSAHDWIIITSYYAIYHSALAALSSVNYKSKNHAATVTALKVFFVNKKLLEQKYIDKLKQARELEEEHIQKIKKAKRQREVSQYSVTKEIGEDAAKDLLEDAREFLNRMDKLISELKESTTET